MPDVGVLLAETEQSLGADIGDVKFGEVSGYRVFFGNTGAKTPPRVNPLWPGLNPPRFLKGHVGLGDQPPRGLLLRRLAASPVLASLILSSAGATEELGITPWRTFDENVLF